MIEVTRDQDGLIYLWGEATIHNVLELHDKLIGLVTQPPVSTNVTLDNLSDLDTAGIQALVSLKKSQPLINFRYKNDRIIELLALLGLSDTFLKNSGDGLE